MERRIGGAVTNPVMDLFSTTEAQHAQQRGLGLLRERLARAEILALGNLARIGASALVAHAAQCREDIDEMDRRFRDLAKAVEQSPTRAVALVEAYLRVTSQGKALADDLAVLHRTKGRLPTVAALAERLTVRSYRRDLECEVAIALVSANGLGASLSPHDLDTLERLAGEPGRHSRRAEALRLLGTQTASGVEPGRTASLTALCLRLLEPCLLYTSRCV